MVEDRRHAAVCHQVAPQLAALHRCLKLQRNSNGFVVLGLRDARIKKMLCHEGCAAACRPPLPSQTAVQHRCFGAPVAWFQTRNAWPHVADSKLPSSGSAKCGCNKAATFNACAMQSSYKHHTTPAAPPRPPAKAHVVLAFSCMLVSRLMHSLTCGASGAAPGRPGRCLPVQGPTNQGSLHLFFIALVTCSASRSTSGSWPSRSPANSASGGTSAEHTSRTRWL